MTPKEIALFVFTYYTFNTEGLKHTSKLSYKEIKKQGNNLLDGELLSWKVRNNKDKIEYFTEAVKEFRKL
jgi:hypothetical protein